MSPVPPLGLNGGPDPQKDLSLLVIYLLHLVLNAGEAHP